jgi:hypothetical protein
MHGEQPSERDNQGPVGPAEPRWSVGASEHGKLVAQHQDLDLLGSLGSGTQHRPAQELETTSSRSAAAPSTDHAALPSATMQQVTGCVHSFGHPQVRIPLAPLLLFRSVRTVRARQRPADNLNTIFIDRLSGRVSYKLEPNWSGPYPHTNWVNDPLLVRGAVGEGLGLFEPFWCASITNLMAGRSLHG